MTIIPPTRRMRHQSGLSLIELMVGISIGLLVVLAGMGTIVLSKQTATTQADTTETAGQATHALRLIAQHLRTAGATELTIADPTTPPPIPDRQFLFDYAVTGGATGYDGIDANNDGTRPDLLQDTFGDLAPVNVFGTEGGGSNPDTLTVAFQDRGANFTRDCNGNAAAGAAIGRRIESRFSLVGNTLRCEGLSSANAAAQPIIDNVEDFQISYQMAAAGAASSQWQNAAQVNAVAGWNRVLAVEVCLQVRGQRADLPNTGDTFVNCRGVATAYDGRARLVQRQTVYLRNMGQ